MSKIKNGGLDQYMAKCKALTRSAVKGLIGCVALVAQRPIVIKLSSGRSVGLCVGLLSALWKNGESDPDAVWHHRSDGSMDEAGSGVWGSVHEGVLLRTNLGRANGNFTAYVWYSAATRHYTTRTPKLLWANLSLVMAGPH